MGKYGDAAIRATDLVRSRKHDSPTDAWQAAVEEIFPNSPSSRAKGCPRGSYLGLCEEGIVTGVRAGKYTRSNDNKAYAINALQILRLEPSLNLDKSELWRRVSAGTEKAQNGQLDVALSLWDKGYIDQSKL
jgi:hypothetical protein